MYISLENTVQYRHNITVLKSDKYCSVYKLKGTTGEGILTCYRVFPGIELVYNEIYMQSCKIKFQSKADILAIDHCLEGRIECELCKGPSTYLQQGDIQINSKNHQVIGFNFPLSHYRGFTIVIHMEEALKSVAGVLEGFNIDLEALHSKLYLRKSPFIVRSKNSINNLFLELNKAPDVIRIKYYKIKVLELLLFLSATDILGSGEERPYFPKKQVETVKEIMKYMTEHPDRHFTLDELSINFSVPLTNLKSCFKSLYGTSVYSYMRTYRIQTAAIMLCKTDESVTNIANRVGYGNPSKFSAAFKSIMGLSPTEYKKQYI